MVQFSIVSGSLKITNSNSEVSLLIAKKDVSCYSRSLYLEVPIVYIYNLNGGYNEIVFEMKLSECEDDTGTPFTIDSFILFAEENLGFDSGAIPQTIGVVDNFSALPNPASVDGQFYWCENSEGVHLTGIYYSNGVSWETNEATEIKVVANYSALPDATTCNGLFYWCEASQGTAWIWGSVGGTYYPSGTYYSNGVTWTYLKSPQQATQTEVDAGVNNDKFVTPNTLENFYKWANIQSQIDGKQASLGFTPFKYVNTTQSIVTGTLSETIVSTATILGGVFLSNDIMKLFYKISKGATLNGVNIRMKINTTNTLLNASQIAILTVTTANTYALLSRIADLSGNLMYLFNVNSSLASDVLSSNTVGGNVAYNPANTIYVFFTIQLGNIADSATFNMANITN